MMAKLKCSGVADLTNVRQEGARLAEQSTKLRAESQDAIKDFRQKQAATEARLVRPNSKRAQTGPRRLQE